MSDHPHMGQFPFESGCANREGPREKIDHLSLNAKRKMERYGLVPECLREEEEAEEPESLATRAEGLWRAQIATAKKLRYRKPRGPLWGVKHSREG